MIHVYLKNSNFKAKRNILKHYILFNTSLYHKN